uniref:Uncharacterized protein n=1 Tax=Sinocyclocheilus anshuiensis TaxID=1608454 RepID=A0A671SCD1_9TELE
IGLNVTFPASRLLALSLLTWDSEMSALESYCCHLSNLCHSHLIQTVLQVFDSHLHVLLHPLQVSTGVLLLLQLLSHHGSLKYKVQSALHGINHSLAVPLDLFHLLVLFSKLPVNLTLQLVHFVDNQRWHNIWRRRPPHNSLCRKKPDLFSYILSAQIKV